MEDFPNFKEINISAIAQPRRTALPIQPEQLPSQVQLRLCERLADEYTAYYFYQNAANWCKGENYRNAAAFFEGEAAAELKHAQGIQDFLVDWNIHPTIPAVETRANIEGLVDIVNHAYLMEFELLQKYSETQLEFFTIHPAAFNFVQGYVNIQNDEVKEYADLLNALTLIDPTVKLDLLHFEETYFKG